MTNIQEVISAFMVMHASGAPCFWPLEQHNMVVCRLLVALLLLLLLLHLLLLIATTNCDRGTRRTGYSLATERVTARPMRAA